MQTLATADELIKRLLHAGPGVTFASEPGVGESPLSEREATGASLSARLALAN